MWKLGGKEKTQRGNGVNEGEMGQTRGNRVDLGGKGRVLGPGGVAAVRSQPVLRVRGDAQVSRAQFAGQVFYLQLHCKKLG